MNWTKEIIGLVIVVAGVLGLYFFGDTCYSNGQTDERLAWQGRENTELVAANNRITDLETKAREDEAKHGQAMAQASATYQESLQNEKANRDRTIADLRSGALRLRIQLAGRQSTDGSSAGQADPAAVRCDGETFAELSGSAAEFLVGLASEADDVVHQLTACQAVVTADRQFQGEK